MLPLPCCLCRHRSAAASAADVLLPCPHDHVLMFCAEHASHSHLSNLPIYLFCAADSRTTQNQNSICCPPPPPFSMCCPPRVHPSSWPSSSSSRTALRKITYQQTHHFFAICVKVILFIMKTQRPNFLLMKKIVVVSIVSRDYSEFFCNQQYLEQVYIRVAYNLELLKVALTNITKVKIRYSGKIFKFRLRLVLFLELLLKIPDGLLSTQ
jgi:hypothetical protein